VAPYEADAQLAFLNKAGIAQVIVTEDSDLLLFGCDRVCKIKTLKECPVYRYLKIFEGGKIILGSLYKSCIPVIMLACAC
jgi:5'-3' exonuclease